MGLPSLVVLLTINNFEFHVITGVDTDVLTILVDNRHNIFESIVVIWACRKVTILAILLGCSLDTQESFTLGLDIVC